MIPKSTTILTAKKSFITVCSIVIFFFFLQFVKDALYRWDGYSYYMTFFEFLPHLSLSYVLWTVQGAVIAFVVWTATYGLHRFTRARISLLTFDHLMVLFFFGGLILFTLTLLVNFTITQLVAASIHHFIVVLICLILFVISLRLTEKYFQIRKILFGIAERISPLVWLSLALFVLALPVSFLPFKTPINHDGTAQSASDVLGGSEVPNIIVIVMDSLTARDMELYGYDRPTTPFLSKWSKDAIVFNRAYSQANWTTPATMSILTGQRPWTHGVWYRAERRFNKKYDNNMVKVLRDHGYAAYSFAQNKYGHPETLGIGDAFMVKDDASSFWIAPNIGIKKMTCFFMSRPIVTEWMVENNPLIRPLNLKLFREPIHSNLIRSETVYNRFLKYISLQNKEPFFAWIHVYPPHELYLPSEPYMGTFGSKNKYNTAEKQLESNLLYQYYNPVRQGDVDILRKRYDEFIADSDRQLELFFMHLNDTINMSNTIVIVTSDHGESFSHEYQGHGGTALHEQLVHIPLIIKMPSRRPALRRNNNINEINVHVEQVDIAPTILELVGIPVPEWMEGRSLLPLMNGEMIDSRPVWSMQLENNRSLGNDPIEKGTIAVWDGDYKLIFDIMKRTGSLFNIHNDPDEMNNLINEEPEIGKRLLTLVKNKLGEVNKRMLENR